MLPRCRTLLGLSELPTNDDPLSLSLNLSLLLSFTTAESHSSVVSFSQKGKRKREKKKIAERAQNFCFKNNDEKSERFSQQQKNKKKQKISLLQNFSSLILLSRERKKERKMHFQVVNCPSQVRTLRILLLTHTEIERDLSFSLSLNSFFVLLSFSSSAFCCFRRVSSLCVCLCERIESRKRNWKWCRSRSRTFSL